MPSGSTGGFLPLMRSGHTRPRLQDERICYMWSIGERRTRDIPQDQSLVISPVKVNGVQHFGDFGGRADYPHLPGHEQSCNSLAGLRRTNPVVTVDAGAGAPWGASALAADPIPASRGPSGNALGRHSIRRSCNTAMCRKKCTTALVANWPKVKVKFYRRSR